MSTKAKSSPQYWLLKSEPSTYSIVDLKKDKKTNWNNIRNYQARNFLKVMTVGDLCLIYHSMNLAEQKNSRDPAADRSVVGIAEITKTAYPDIDHETQKEWLQVDIRYQSTFKTPVSLDTLKTHPQLKKLPLIKQSRLSVMPISEQEFNTILKLGN